VQDLQTMIRHVMIPEMERLGLEPKRCSSNEIYMKTKISRANARENLQPILAGLPNVRTIEFEFRCLKTETPMPSNEIPDASGMLTKFCRIVEGKKCDLINYIAEKCITILQMLDQMPDRSSIKYSNRGSYAALLISLVNGDDNAFMLQFTYEIYSHYITITESASLCKPDEENYVPYLFRILTLDVFESSIVVCDEFRESVATRSTLAPLFDLPETDNSELVDNSYEQSFSIWDSRDNNPNTASEDPEFLFVPEISPNVYQSINDYISVIIVNYTRYYDLIHRHLNLSDDVHDCPVTMYIDWCGCSILINVDISGHTMSYPLSLVTFEQFVEKVIRPIDPRLIKRGFSKPPTRVTKTRMTLQDCGRALRK